MKQAFYSIIGLSIIIAYLLWNGWIKFNSGNAETPTETIHFINGTYALLTGEDGGDYNKIGGFKKTWWRKITVKKMLKDSRDITDLNTGMKTLNKLLSDSGMLNNEFMQTLKMRGVDKMTPQDLEHKIQTAKGMRRAQEYRIQYDAYNELGEKAIIGWDLGYGNFLLANLYLAGYMDENTALNKSLEITERIQQIFKSWNEYNRSFMYGYNYWTSRNIDLAATFLNRQNIITKLEADAKSPFQIGWATVLKKDWK
ncbi:DUF1266 domain-containing protein [Chitinophagaceae bacterium LWZ2-11]